MSKFSRYATVPTEEPNLRGSQRAANFRFRRKVLTALFELAQYHCVSRSGFLSGIILREYRNTFKEEPTDIPKSRL